MIGNLPKKQRKRLYQDLSKRVLISLFVTHTTSNVPFFSGDRSIIGHITGFIVFDFSGGRNI